MSDPVYARQVARIVASMPREELIAIVMRLPLTADGVPIVPGMKLYPLHPLPPEDLDGDEDYAVVEMHATDPFGGDDIEPADLSKNYSSREAAEAARNLAKGCPSTHCNRREECASPNDCIRTEKARAEARPPSAFNPTLTPEEAERLKDIRQWQNESKESTVRLLDGPGGFNA